jgi:hypothetical protein
MGPPLSGSCWRCPFCDSSGSSFSVRPPLPNKPVKYKCFRCNVWGDEHDLLKLFHPELNYPGRRRVLARYRDQYEAAQTVPEAVPTHPTPRPQTPGAAYPSGDRGATAGPPERTDEFSPRADLLRAEIAGHIRAAVAALRLDDGALAALWELCGRVLHVAALAGLSPETLSARCLFEAAVALHESQHRAECKDAGCEWACCRLARGWTLEQIRQAVGTDDARDPAQQEAVRI